MTKKTNLFQKASIVFGGVSLVLALISAVWLYLRVGEVGSNNPVSASLMAATFFFLCVGGITLFIGFCSLPSFSFASDEKDQR